jgi:S1-C subfamily serine protease
MKATPALLALLCVVAAPAKDKAASPAPSAGEKVLELEPMKIEGRPIISFAFDIVIYVDPATTKVSRIFITRVHEGTDADRLGLHEGDEIVKLEGVPVKGMEASVKPESTLGRLFLNRTPGDPLDFEAIVRRTERLTVRAQQPTLLERLR